MLAAIGAVAVWSGLPDNAMGTSNVNPSREKTPGVTTSSQTQFPPLHQTGNKRRAFSDAISVACSDDFEKCHYSIPVVKAALSNEGTTCLTSLPDAISIKKSYQFDASTIQTLVLFKSCSHALCELPTRQPGI